MTKQIEYVERVPSGWFVFDVMRQKERGWDWVALISDVDHVDFRNGARCSTAWLRIPGKYRSRDAAYDVVEGMMATKH